MRRIVNPNIHNFRIANAEGRIKNDVFRSEKADFNINNVTFEVGGKGKNQEQIKNLKNAYIVKDDIEYGYQNVVPLWAFGLNY